MLIRMIEEGHPEMRLLIVEDDQDGREMLTELFRMHAWQVTPVPTTAAALVELRAGGFDVVISDENLEGASGSAMLREASRLGLLHNVGALMYTADPGQLELPPGVRVLHKPMAITRLVDEVVAAAASHVPRSGAQSLAAWMCDRERRAPPSSRRSSASLSAARHESPPSSRGASSR
jgi:DNA-binding response OmpR family regulator